MTPSKHSLESDMMVEDERRGGGGRRRLTLLTAMTSRSELIAIATRTTRIRRHIPLHWMRKTVTTRTTRRGFATCEKGEESCRVKTTTTSNKVKVKVTAIKCQWW
mmetsp:Transcript_19186/g.55839  ORF Transcript_19186/g.55839 Transcript_19186/m.55839 type:complete len:105 (-) Transcript_19186:411-725(-)